MLFGCALENLYKITGYTAEVSSEIGKKYTGAVGNHRFVNDITEHHILPVATAYSESFVHDASIPRTWQKRFVIEDDVPATGTGTDYTANYYIGAFNSPPNPLTYVSADIVGLRYYNARLHQWFRRIAITGLAGLYWDHDSFDSLFGNAFWLSDREDADDAAAHVVDYQSSSVYYYYDESNGKIRTLSDYVAGEDGHKLWRYDVIGALEGGNDESAIEVLLDERREDDELIENRCFIIWTEYIRYISYIC